MIFVTIGTQDKAFTRLLNYVEEADIKDEVIIQSGFTEFKSNKYKVFKYLNKDEFNKYLKEADVIICHGGVGSIMHSLSMHKKVIACARLEKYKEHQNNHQKQIIESFKEKGYLLELSEDNKLEDLLEEIKTFTPKEYEYNHENFMNKLIDYIEGK